MSRRTGRATWRAPCCVSAQFEGFIGAEFGARLPLARHSGPKLARHT